MDELVELGITYADQLMRHSVDCECDVECLSSPSDCHSDCDCDCIECLNDDCRDCDCECSS